MEGAFLNVSTYTVPQYYTVICSYLWLYAAIYGYMQLFMVICSYLWLYAAIYGYMQLFMVICSYLWFISLFRRFRKIAKETNSFVMCPSVRPHGKLGSHWTDFQGI